MQIPGKFGFGGMPFDAAIGLDGRLVKELLRQQRKGEGHTFDVAIIGSGLGGGTLALRHLDMELDTLLLEAGDLTGNVDDYTRQLEERASCGTLYEAAADAPLRNPDCNFIGGEVRVFGGKGTLWGGLAVKPKGWEIRRFPDEVAAYLLRDQVYNEAALLIGAGNPASTLQPRIKAEMTGLFPGWTHEDAQYAVRREGLRFAGPTAMFNPGEALLLKIMKRRFAGKSVSVSVHLRHEVQKLTSRRPHYVEIDVWDHESGLPKRFRARKVVLAAGTLGTAVLSFKSGLSDSTGVGVTDHPILYTRFTIPNDSPFYSPDSQSKTVSQPHDASPEHRRYNLLLEMNTGRHEDRYSHLNRFRTVDTNNEAGSRVSPTTSEIVFILHSPLDSRNRLYLDPISGHPKLTMFHTEVSATELSDMQSVADAIIERFKGQCLAGNEKLLTASLGCVAHEVGSMAMGVVTDPNFRILGHDNIYVCDLSAFNISMAANPTLTLVALTSRLASHIRSIL